MGQRCWFVRLIVLVTAATAMLAASVGPAAAATFALIPPLNDSQALATYIRYEDFPYRAYNDTRGATAEPGDPTCAGSDANVWYVVTGTGTPVTIDTYGSNYDTTLSVYLSSAALACNDDAGGTSQSELTIDTVAGYEYHVMVGTKAGEPGGLLLFTALMPGQTPPDVVPPPPNDQIYDATEIAALPFTDQEDTRGAFESGYESGYCGVWKSVWYHYRPDTGAHVFFDTFGSDYNTELSVYRYTDADGLQQIACNDDSGVGDNYQQSRVELDVAAGTDYYVLVTEPYQYSMPQGGILQFHAGTIVPFAITVQIDPTARFSRKHITAAVTGSTTCTRPATVTVEVTLTQTVNGVTTSGHDFSSVACDPAQAAPWRVNVFPDAGRWRAGTAHVVADAQSDSLGETSYAHAERDVTLRPGP
jgi:hypothetical protein